MNFAEILESQLRQEIRKKLFEEIAPSTSSDPLIPSELWTQLVGKITPQRFMASQQAARVYHQLRPHPKPRPAHVLSSEQTQAFQFFLFYGSDLHDNFTSKELKSAFRKLALKLHPDQGGQAEAFLSLKKAFERLQMVWSQNQCKGR